MEGIDIGNWWLAANYLAEAHLINQYWITIKKEQNEN